MILSEWGINFDGITLTYLDDEGDEITVDN